MTHEDTITQVENLYELRSFIGSIDEKEFNNYLINSSEKFYKKVNILVKNAKLKEDIIESPTKDAMLLSISDYLYGVDSYPKQEKKTEQVMKTTIFNKEKQLKRIGMIIPLDRKEMMEQLKSLYHG